MRNYKEISKCPPELLQIIELVNLLPVDAETIFEEICDERSIWRDKRGVVIRDSAKDVFNEKLVEYIFDREPVTGSVERFEDLTKAQTLFRHFAEVNNKFPKWSEIENDRNRQMRFLLQFLTVDLRARQFPVSLGITPEGFLKPVRSEFLEIFDKHDIPIYRIRSCEVCSKIFWAKRTDSQACEKQCSNVLSQRKYQARLNEHNRRRKENREYKKGLKNNGTL